MARPSTLDSMNIGQLQQLLMNRKSELAKLQKQRNEFQKKVDAIDRKVAKLNGAGIRGTGRRVRNEKSLNEMMEDALRSKAKPMSVGDIVDAVKAAGYVSNSANFRGIVNQTLIKDKRFGNSGERGMYQLKK